MYHPDYDYSESSSSASSPSPFDYYPPAFDHSPLYLQDPQKSRPQRSARQVQVQISHPYARLFAKKDEVKRRKIWNHALEKNLFNPFELQVNFLSLEIFLLNFLHRSTLSAPNRRIIYIASLEAHVDRLHSQLLE